MEHRKTLLLRVSGDGPTANNRARRRAGPSSGPSGMTALLLMLALLISLLTLCTVVANKDMVSAKMNSLRVGFQQQPLPTQPAPASAQLKRTVDASTTRQELLSKLQNKIADLKATVKDMRVNKRLVMPWNPEAVAMTKQLQAATRCYLQLLHGDINKRIILLLSLQFPDVMLQQHEWLREETEQFQNVSLFVELAPMRLLPHATHTVRFTLLYMGWIIL